MMNQDKKLLKKIEQKKKKRKELEIVGTSGLEENLKAISDALDEYYFTEKLKTYCAHLSYTKIINKKAIKYKMIDFRLINSILHVIDIFEFSNPVIYFYNEIRKLYENIDENDDHELIKFDKLLSGIKNYSLRLSIEDAEELLSFLANFCVRKLNENKKEYLNRYFLISNLLLNIRFNTKTGKSIKIPPNVFKNMVVTALKIADELDFSTIETVGIIPDNPSGFSDAYEWVEKFIDSFKKNLDKKGFDNYYPYCSALLEFKRGNYIKAYRTLYEKRKGTRGVFINLDIKTLFLRILFEIYITKPQILEYDEIDIEKTFDTLRSLLRDEASRKKQLSYQLKFYTDFADLYKKLYKFFNRYTLAYKKKNSLFEKEKNQLLSEIENTKYSYKKWFLQKVKSIK
ncbi:MAG: hypothetical protein AAFZ15_19815 [Bacteroidota bacterium]